MLFQETLAEPFAILERVALNSDFHLHHSTSVNVTLIMRLQQGHWIRLELWNFRGVSSISFNTHTYS